MQRVFVSETQYDRRVEGWELATIAFVLLAFAAVARRLESSVVTSAIFFTSAGLLAGPVFGAHRPAHRSRARQAAGRGDADPRPLRRRVADLAPRPAQRVRGPAALARDRAAADDPGRHARRRRRPPGRQPGRGTRALDHARLHRRGARSSGRDRRADSVTDPARPQRRERPERRDLRPTLLHRAGPRRGRGRGDDGARRGAARAGGDRLRPRRGSRSRRPRCARAPICDASRPRGAALVPDPDRGHGRPLRGDRHRARRQHLHRRVHRRVRVRRHPPQQRRRRVISSGRGRRGAQRGHVHRLRRGDSRPRPRRPGLGGRRLRGAQPDGGADGAGRALAAGNRCPAADARLRRVVRPARPRHDRLRGDHDRRVIAPTRADDAARRGRDDRHLGLCARPQLAPAHGSLRPLVRVRQA